MIHLLVPFHSDAARLRKFVACLNVQTVKPYVYFMDAGSTDESAREARKYQGIYRVIHIPDWNYWGGSIVAGREHLTTRDDDIVGIMNNDVTFGPQFFQLIERMMAPGLLVSAFGVEVQWHKVFDLKHGVIPTVPKVFSPNTCPNYAIFLEAREFHKLRLDPRLLPHYQFDYAWPMQAIKNGLYPIVLPGTVHVDYSTTGIIPKRLRDFFSIRYSENPVYLSNYVLLCCPWRYKLPMLARVWGYCLVKMWRMWRAR